MTNPFVNPRFLYRDNGREAIRNMLENKGNYVPKGKVLTSLCNTLWDLKPLMLEGERGTGKTALAESVAKAFGLKIFIMSCHSKTDLDDLIGTWNIALQDYYSKELRSDGKKLSEIGRLIRTKEFFDFGMILQSLNYSKEIKRPSILLLDEVDKLDERAEDFLLQFLARGLHRRGPLHELGARAEHRR